MAGIKSNNFSIYKKIFAISVYFFLLKLQYKKKIFNDDSKIHILSVNVCSFRITYFKLNTVK